MTFTEEDIKVNKIFRGKDKRIFRQVLWVGKNRLTGDESVQYDSNTVGRGRHYPKTTMTAFLKWAKEDFTGQLVDGEWELKEEVKHVSR